MGISDCLSCDYSDHMSYTACDDQRLNISCRNYKNYTAFQSHIHPLLDVYLDNLSTRFNPQFSIHNILVRYLNSDMY